MSGLKKKGPAKRVAKRARQADSASKDFMVSNSRRRSKRDSVKTMFLDSFQ